MFGYWLYQYVFALSEGAAVFGEQISVPLRKAFYHVSAKVCKCYRFVSFLSFQIVSVQKVKRIDKRTIIRHNYM